VPNYAAVDAAIDPRRQRLFVSLNNGIPGSNNGNELAVYDLASGQVIRQDAERSVGGLAVDETTGAVFSPRSHIATLAVVKYDTQGQVLRRLMACTVWRRSIRRAGACTCSRGEKRGRLPRSIRI
jgi:hypothetical protein